MLIEHDVVQAPLRYFLAAAVALLCVMTLGLGSAQAGELSGTFTDAATGHPIEGASVRVMGTHETAKTDAHGRYAFELPDGVYELAIRAEVGDAVYESRMVRQYVPQILEARPYVYTDWFLNQGIDPQKHAPGMPSFSGEGPEGGPETVDLRDLFGSGEPNPLYYTIPSDQPATIRVGRRRESTGSGGCSDSVNPIVAIESMSLDEYVKGVLPPEIGVFQNIPGASEVYKAFAIAAKSYALYFVLRYGPGNRRSLGRSVPPNNYTWFHIDDTACNQRYTSQRLTITTNAANAVANKIMAKRSDPNSLDKYEYAASCGKHGTRPEHQTALVSDRPPVSSCVGSWCGHNSCAGHETNTAVSGSNRCLVRGICQWGAASWGEAGKSYTWLLSHYQPNLALRNIGQTGPATVALSGYAYTDAGDIAGSGVAGVTISLSDGQTTSTDAQGSYLFDAVREDLGSVEITTTKSGYDTATRTKDLEPGVTNWGSIQISVSTNTPPDPDPDPDPADVGTPDTGSPVDAGADAAQPGDADSQADTSPPDTQTNDVGTSTEQDLQDPHKAEFGPLVQPSSGSYDSGGCGGCAATSGANPSLPGGLLAAWMSISWIFFRRRRS
ncbi:carboxypeptidase regulatory-like domain-containing protein [Bradymonas sediminis]|nr:carboxypeptidase regulatory-like domain-containing protein [Bradymonas sediminis]TDP77500.1 stage II sporulation protein [Bradymonas sediminis]